MLRVLLVNPPPQSKQEAYYDTPPYPRTGLACLAASLRAAAVNVQLLDCKYDGLGQEEALQKIVACQPAVIGFTAFTNEIMQAAVLAVACKNALPDSVTIIGGVHVSVLPEKTLRQCPCFDYAVVAEGEITLIELICALREKRSLNGIKGVGFLDGQGNYFYGGDRERIANLDKLAEPAWDMFRPAKEYILHTQRGCPFCCPFCVNPNGRLVRAESVARVVRQIASLYEKGCRTLFIGDEVFTLDRNRTLAICAGLIAADLHRKIRWRCTTHINCIDYELAKKMRQSGCYLVGLGLESGDENQLKVINKQTSIEKILRAVSDLKRAKLPFEGYFVLGQPNETVVTAKSSIDFAIRINPDYPVFGIMVPYPGTAIGRMAAAGEGGYRLIARDWNDYNKQFGDALDFAGVERRLLERMQLQGYLKVFLYNWRLVGLLKFCWQYRSNGWTAVKRIFCRDRST
jgi:anaerobic magnesium-protoporphyrin IX monomethyl ester cyclase